MKPTAGGWVLLAAAPEAPFMSENLSAIGEGGQTGPQSLPEAQAALGLTENQQPIDWAGAYA
jgi:hypothetical protein